MTTKTEAASEVRKVLQLVKDRIEQPGGIKVNEATTRAHFLNPLLAALGYGSIDEIEFEHYLPDGKTFLDYRLVINGKPRVSVEAKSLESSLTEKDAAQVVAYAAILGDEWAVLTNAREWQLYHAFAQAPLSEKRILTIDLVGWTSDTEFDRVFEQLWLVSRESFVDGGGPNTWLTTKRLDQWLTASLMDPQSIVVKTIRRRAEADGLQAEADQISGWFKAHIQSEKAFAEASPHEAYPIVSSPLSAAISSTAAGYESSQSLSADQPSYWLVPAGKQQGFSATQHLTNWLSKGFWGFGESTPGRKRMRPGDWIAFYAAKANAILAQGRLAGPIDTYVSEAEWPGPGPHASHVYKVPLVDIAWLDSPILVDAGLRARLDAFRGKNAAIGWSWFVQTTRRLSKLDFESLIGK